MKAKIRKGRGQTGERTDPRAHGGLADVERGGRAMKPAVACNRQEGLELQDFHGPRYLPKPRCFPILSAPITFVYQLDSDYPFD